MIRCLDMFQYETEVNMSTLNNEHQFSRLESSFFFSLPITKSKKLIDSLEEYFKTEVLNGPLNGFNYNGKVMDVHIQKKIKTLPKYLVIHLKRLDFDFNTFQVAFNNAKIEFPMELDMGPLTKEKKKQEYKLYAVIGYSHNKRHYIVFVKVNENWYLIDDEHVKLVTEDEVLNMDGKIASSYMLWYERDEKDGLNWKLFKHLDEFDDVIFE